MAHCKYLIQARINIVVVSHLLCLGQPVIVYMPKGILENSRAITSSFLTPLCPPPPPKRKRMRELVIAVPGILHSYALFLKSNDWCANIYAL